MKDEGGYSNDPDDAGGPTKYGITIADVRKYIKKDATAEDVKALTEDEAKVIYKQRYWDALNCDNLPSGVDYTCFDYGVNSGIGRPKVALNKFKDKTGADLINAINDERMDFLKGLVSKKPSQQKFMKGWTARVNSVRSKSLDLAKSTVTGPATGVVVAAGTAAATVNQHFWSAHPIATVAAIVVGAAVIGYIIHLIMNKGNQNA
jgi:lysozyme family protein